MLVGVLIAGYAVLDGFDLGVGILHLFVKGDEERRLSINSIGPVWDGNEVWLVTAGGALFAAFPEVYASAFSGFYTAFMLLLLTLIFRAVAIEFRSKHPSPRWRQSWDVVFSAASFGAALLMGVAFGNVISGVPIDSDRQRHRLAAGSAASVRNSRRPRRPSRFLPSTVRIYLVLKTDGPMQARVRVVDPPAGDHFLTRLCHHDDGDVAVSAAHGRADPERAGAVRVSGRRRCWPSPISRARSFTGGSSARSCRRRSRSSC